MKIGMYEFSQVFGEKDTDMSFAQDPYVLDAKSGLSACFNNCFPKAGPTCTKEWNIVSVFWREALSCELNPEMFYQDT